MQVDFYLVKDDAQDAALKVTCRLIEKAYLRNHRVFVYCNNQQEAEELDELLWTFRDDSFIPHNLQGEGPEPPPPIQIGFKNNAQGFRDILINLSSTIPQFVSQFRRVLEVVAHDEESKEICREHYREYRKKSYKLNTHEIT